MLSVKAILVVGNHVGTEYHYGSGELDLTYGELVLGCMPQWTSRGKIGTWGRGRGEHRLLRIVYFTQVC